jgi:Mlc titration factor MtfA (ptsG expression regulator)
VIRRRRGLPAEWETIAARQLGAWNGYDPGEQERLGALGDWLLRRKNWEAAHGFELDDVIRTTIAIEAAMLVLGLDTDYYREVSAVIVYPTTILSHGEREGPAYGTVTDESVELFGEAHDERGAILIAWDEARVEARHPGRGSNVVFHEFAHKIDMLDDWVDGTPPLDTKEQRERWIRVCTDAFEALSEGELRPPLDPYGGESPAEFFAVATEAFFCVPLALEEQEREVFEVLRDFYKQDPAERARRVAGSFH